MRFSDFKVINMKDDCIFCKLANGIIPANSIYQDDDFNVIMDAMPATKGHALIIPKKHCQDIFDVVEKTAEKIFPLAKKISAHMKEVLSCDGVNICQNNGAEAGQTVFHLHVHIIPRYKGKDSILTWTHEDISEEEIKAICDSLKL